MENLNQQNENQESLIKEREDQLEKIVKEEEDLEQQEQQVSDQIDKVDEEIRELEQNNPDIKKMNKRRERLKGLMDESKENLNSLTKDQLEEIENYKNPPERIKKALEVIFLLLEGKVLDWDTIKRKLNQGTFVKKMMTFDVTKVKFNVIKQVKKDYIDQDDWNMEKLKRASQAMGPLGTWLEIINAQIDESTKKESNKFKKAKKQLNDLKKKKKQLQSRQKELQEKKNQKQQRKRTITKQIDDIKNGNMQCPNCLILEEQIVQYQHCENCIYFYERVENYERTVQTKNNEIKELLNCENCIFIQRLYEDAEEKLHKLKNENFQLQDCQKCKELQSINEQNQKLIEELKKKLSKKNEELKESNEEQQKNQTKDCQNCDYLFQMYEKLDQKQKEQLQQIHKYKDCQNCKYFYDIIQNQNKQPSAEKNSEQCKNCPGLQNKLEDLKSNNQKLQEDVEKYKNCDNCVYIYEQLENTQKQVQTLQTEKTILIEKQNYLMKQLEQFQQQIQQQDQQQDLSSKEQSKKFQSQEFVKVYASNNPTFNEVQYTSNPYKFKNVTYVNAMFNKDNQKNYQSVQQTIPFSNNNIKQPQSIKQQNFQVYSSQYNKIPQSQQIKIQSIPVQRESNVFVKKQYPQHKRSLSSNINYSQRQSYQSVIVNQSLQKPNFQKQNIPQYVPQTQPVYRVYRQNLQDEKQRAESTLAYHTKRDLKQFIQYIN